MIGGAKSVKPLGKTLPYPRKWKGQEPPKREHAGYETFKATEYITGTRRKPDTVIVYRRGQPGGGSSGFNRAVKDEQLALKWDLHVEKMEKRKAKRESPEYRKKLDEKVARRLAAKAAKRAA